jgi:dihydroorotase
MCESYVILTVQTKFSVEHLFPNLEKQPCVKTRETFPYEHSTSRRKPTTHAFTLNFNLHLSHGHYYNFVIQY